MLKTRKQRGRFLTWMTWSPIVALWAWILWDARGARGLLMLGIGALLVYGLFKLIMFLLEWQHAGADE